MDDPYWVDIATNFMKKAVTVQTLLQRRDAQICSFYKLDFPSKARKKKDNEVLLTKGLLTFKVR
jgi:hypothetical protein